MFLSNLAFVHLEGAQNQHLSPMINPISVHLLSLKRTIDKPFDYAVKNKHFQMIMPLVL